VSDRTAIPLSIVIPCKDDWRVLECVDSIDVDCEALVIINGCKSDFITEVMPQLTRRKAKVLMLEEANLSAALQHGVDHAKHNAMLFMDSDCQFETGAIGKLVSAMSHHGPGQAVFKGLVCFDSGHGFLSKLIAQSRHIHTGAPPTAYKPPLLAHRCLAGHIGGYFFNPLLRWKEDADLDWRLRQAGVTVVPVSDARIHHAALEIFTDLRSNFRYGVGAALGQILDIPLTSPDRTLRHAYQSGGLAVTAYMLLANMARSTGYGWTLATSQTENDD